MVSRVYRVDDVQVGFTLGGPNNEVPALVIQATGTVNSGGWKNAELGAWIYIKPPEDGIADLDFFATPPDPGSNVNWMLAPIVAKAVLPIPEWVRGIRVHAASNKIEQMFDRAGPQLFKGGDPTPWPWGGDAHPWPWCGPIILPL